MKRAARRTFFIPEKPGGTSRAHVQSLLTKVVGDRAPIANAAPSREPVYDANYVYRKAYESRLLKGVDVTPRPWNIHALVASKMHSNAIVADVGCGTAYKSLLHAAQVQLLIGLEPNEEMIGCAISNAIIAGVFNVCFMTGTCNDMPFGDSTIDVLVGFLAPHNPREIHRVLKPGGWAVVERVGDRDKVNIKQYFGADQEGPRGQLMHCAAGERARQMAAECQEYFSSVDVRNGFWDTKYTLEQLVALLEQTPTVRRFSLQNDRPALDRITAELTVNGTITTTQNRVLIIAQK